jgi:hypothetical protein
MSTSKISELPSAGALSSTDLVLVVASNVTSKSTVSNLFSSSPNDIYAVVGTAGTITINDGASTITLPANFSGYRIRVFRNGTLLDYESQGMGDPYYTYNSGTRVITLSTNASTSEKFVIMAY